MALPILDGNQTATTLSTILTGGAHIPAHTVVSLGSQAITDISNAVSGVQVSGTVTANTGYDKSYNIYQSPPSNAVQLGYADSGNFFVNVRHNNGLPVQVVSQGSVTIGAMPAISGTVTANVPITTIGDGIGSYVGDYGPFPISGTVTANSTVQNATAIAQAVIDESDSYGAVNVNIQSSSGNVAVVGTVTASNPSGALTTRFGSVTTANTAQLTSAVTNTSRKYLLVQNIATSTVTIGIGFAPTTTQGIQLTAGAGLTFDAFCPTGGVWWLSSTTGSNFSILEG